MKYHFFYVFLLALTSLTSVSYAVTLQGDITKGGLVYMYHDDVESAYLNNKKLNVFDDLIIFGFGRDDKLNNTLKIVYKNGLSAEHKFTLQDRKYNEQKINSLPKEYVDPGKSFWSRIKSENAKIAVKRAETIKTCNLSEGFIIPSEGIISGIYGSRRILNGKPKRPHYGLDIAAPKGTKVVSPMSGKVTLADDDMYYTGQTIMVNHGCGLVSVFSHLSKITVSEGEFIKQGQKIGEVGSTGRSTGAHLDWRVNHYRSRLDPELLLKMSRN